MSTRSEAPGTYRLADHVRACQIGRQTVLLDLKAGRYLALSRQGPGSEDCPQDDVWPAAVGASPPFLRDLAGSAIEPLVRSGLVVADPAPVAPATILPEPLYSLHAELVADHQPLTVAHVLSLWASAGVAALWLRCRTLADIVDRVARLTPAGPSAARCVPRPLQEAVAIYMRARPFAFTAHDKCLLDSLTLIHFLARRGLHAQWVIGVGTRPFRAHAWVQHGHVVLNDAHENVRRHHPILVV